jgi:hypothetical protein
MARCVLASVVTLSLLFTLEVRAECLNEPTVTFGIEAAKPGGMSSFETVTVNGTKWTHRYGLEGNTNTGIPVHTVLPDCRVLIVGRKTSSPGYRYFVVINDVEWAHSLESYSSKFTGSVRYSKDGKKVLQFDSKGTLVVDDVVQPRIHISNELKDAHFDDDGNVVSTWNVGGREVHAIDGKVVQ